VSYADFLEKKTFVDHPSGFDFEIRDDQLTRGGEYELKDFQAAIVRWALRRGRAALFEDTGLGKTAQQVSWAWCVHQFDGSRVLIFAPLCVAQQTVEEAARFGIKVTYVRSSAETKETGVYITNYEMIEHFEESLLAGWFGGVVLDESSILKSQDSKTRARLIRACGRVPYRLSCTATPAPNDFIELAQQAEFLGIMTAAEMLATFFIHNSGQLVDGDGQKWRLKGHAKSRFWEWLATWAVFIRKPSDLGFSDEGYNLPPLEIEEIIVPSDLPVAKTLPERIKARKATIDERVRVAAEIANAMPDGEPCLLWCHLNEESAKLAKLIPTAAEVKGSDPISWKEKNLLGFCQGDPEDLVTKAKIAGFGMNWQHCATQIHVGLSDSWEQLYQAIRRSYRFGQKRPVRAILITSAAEGATRENVKRKQRQADEMAEAMVAHMREFCRRQVIGTERERGAYERDIAAGKAGKDGEDFVLHLGDCVDVAREIPDDSIDFSVFSPPFASLFTYSNLERDMGNSKNHAVFQQHFEFLVKEMIRIMRPGRLVSVHIQDLIATKSFDGFIGIHDFSGRVIKAFVEAGFYFHSRLTVWKDPVVAMQRTKSIGLLWKQIKKDSSISRQGLPDYVITFRKPGVNTKPLSHTPEEFPVRLWQQLASPCWNDIRQSNTLNRKLAREESDERHICPLQLDLIERLCFLWSAPGDVVFSPFAGIGSEGYVALTMGRKFIGSELKRSYFEIAKQNLIQAEGVGYRFPFFSDKVGDWKPGIVDGAAQAEHEDQQLPGLERDPAQVDLFADGFLQLPTIEGHA
jgi:DNA modification methylase